MFSPKRTCVACRTKKNKDELFKVVLKKDEENVHLALGYSEGRGAFICKSEECIALAEKKKAFNRSFRRPCGNIVFEELREKMND